MLPKKTPTSTTGSKVRQPSASSLPKQNSPTANTNKRTSDTIAMQNPKPITSSKANITSGRRTSDVSTIYKPRSQSITSNSVKNGSKRKGSDVSTKRLPSMSSSFEDDPDEDRIDGMPTKILVVPPDGGWGWVIVAAAFYCNMVVDGSLSAFGVYMSTLSVEFKVTRSEVSIVGSLLTGFDQMLGPLVSALANRYGFRTVAIVGSVIACAGMSVSYTVQSLNLLCFTYGVLGGIGFGMIYVPAAIAVSFYFTRWRALATCIGLCGSSIGGVVMPLMIGHCIATLGWRITMLIQAGLLLSCSLVGLLFQPLKPVVVQRTSKVITDIKQTSPQNKIKIIFRSGQTNKTPHPTASIPLKSRSTSSRTSSRRVTFQRHNTSFPTILETILDQDMSKRNKSESKQSIPHVKIVSAIDYMTEKYGTQDDTSESSSIVIGVSGPLSGERMMSSTSFNEGIRRKKPRCWHCCLKVTYCHCHRKKFWHNVGVRPLYRDDIFFDASLVFLPEYKSKLDNASYHMAVTRVATSNDLLEERNSRCLLCPESITRTLATMLDVSLLKHYSFVLMILSSIFLNASYYVPYMYVADRAITNGADPKVACYLVPSISIAGMVGRIACGLMSSLPYANPLIIVSVALTCAGVAVISIGFSVNMTFQFICCVVYGVGIACNSNLRSIAIVDLLGLDKLTNAFGLLLLFQGVASMFGPPLAGYLKELTGNYDAVFWFAGSLTLMSAFLQYPLNIIKQRNNVKKTLDVVSV